MMVTGAPSPAEALDTPRISLVRSGRGDEAAWSAEVVGLPGCSATGATPEEAVRRAWAAAEGWRVQSVHDEPETPEKTSKHSGRLLIRMPATLHDELAEAAKREGISMNQFITGALASAVEWRSGRANAREETAHPSQRSLRVVLAANLAAVLLAAAVAIVLLVAWRAGW